MCLHDNDMKWMGGKGLKEDTWATYVRAKQKGEIDLLLSEPRPACYKLSTAAIKRARTHMRTHIKRKHIRVILSGKEQSEEDSEHRVPV